MSNIKRFLVFHMEAFFALTPDEYLAMCKQGVKDDGCYEIPQSAKYLKCRPKCIRKSGRDMWSTDASQVLVIMGNPDKEFFECELNHYKELDKHNNFNHPAGGSMEQVKQILGHVDICDAIDSNGGSEEFTASDVQELVKRHMNVELAADDERMALLVKLFNQPLYFQAVAYATKDDYERARSFCATPCYLFESAVWEYSDILQIIEDNYAVKVRSNDGEHSFTVTQEDYVFLTAKALKEKGFNVSIRMEYVVVNGGNVGAATYALERAMSGNLSDTLFNDMPGYKCLSDGKLIFSQSAPDSTEVSLL
ncbi:hypothetical protein [Vibrio harveyi]|uniref:hypothetical protein n=1 Tax=Vibrio harveyi TaxID=669 RepID=UPI003CE91C31